MENNARGELERRFRIIDQMLTGYCILHDRYALRALMLDVGQLLFSVVLGALVFVDPKVIRRLYLTPENGQLIIGVCSVVLFFISLVALRVDWKQLSEKYGRAADVLARQKAICRSVLSDAQADERQIANVLDECQQAVSGQAPIPEREFCRLKVRHRQKVELSKLVDKHPGAPLWLLQVVLFCRAVRGIFSQQHNSEEAEEHAQSTNNRPEVV